MRNKYKRDINLLREDIDRLEKKLDAKSDALFEYRKLIYFLLEHDRNDVVIHNDVHNDGCIVCDLSTYSNYVEVEYIYHIAIKIIRIAMGLCNEAKVIQNDGEKIVIKTYNKDDPKWCFYYRIIKYSGEVVDVTEYYQQEEPTTVSNPDTPTETDFKYFTAEQVRNMSLKEVMDNYNDIMKSMKKWEQENGNS